MNEANSSAGIATAARPSALSRWAYLLLLVSLALNLLVVGAVGGAAWFHRGPPRFEPVFGGAAMSPGEFIGYLRTLPQERRRAIRQAFQGERPKVQQLRAAVQKARAEFAALAAGEPLDRVKLDAAASRLWTAEGDLRRMQLSLSGRVLQVMSQAERIQFIAWRNDRWHGRGGQMAPGDYGDGKAQPRSDGQ